MSRTSIRLAVALAAVVGYAAPIAAQTDPVPSTPGLHVLRFVEPVSSQQRAYLLYLPASYAVSPASPSPVVFMFHGGGGTAGGFTTTLAAAGLGTLADAQGKIIVVPHGLVGTSVLTPGYWNLTDVGRNDVTFTLKLLQYLINNGLNGDLSRVYAGGHSNGAAFVHKLGAAEPTRFRAIADVGGFYGFTDFYGAGAWQPAAPPAGTLLPTFVVHGDADTVVSYGGGPTLTFPTIDFLPTSATYSAWLTNNACTEPSQIAVVATPSSWRRSTVCRVGEVTTRLSMVTLYGHGHAWPTVANSGFDAVAEMLAFFDQQ